MEHHLTVTLPENKRGNKNAGGKEQEKIERRRKSKTKSQRAKRRWK
jgi:hypothetical protein